MSWMSCAWNRKRKHLHFQVLTESFSLPMHKSIDFVEMCFTFNSFQYKNESYQAKRLKRQSTQSNTVKESWKLCQTNQNYNNLHHWEKHKLFHLNLKNQQIIIVLVLLFSISISPCWIVIFHSFLVQSSHVWSVVSIVQPVLLIAVLRWNLRSLLQGVLRWQIKFLQTQLHET